MLSPSLLQRLKERKLVQWALAYLAGAWALVEALGFAGEQFDWPRLALQVFAIVAVFGFFVALVLAWCHGEKGRQRVSGLELLMIALLLVIAGTGLSLLRGRAEPARLPEQATSAEIGSDAETLNRLPGLAVVPFNRLSDRTEDQWFVDGLREELLTRLSRIPGPRVPPRTSIDDFLVTKGRSIPICGAVS